MPDGIKRAVPGNTRLVAIEGLEITIKETLEIINILRDRRIAHLVRTAGVSSRTDLDVCKYMEIPQSQRIEIPEEIYIYHLKTPGQILVSDGKLDDNNHDDLTYNNIRKTQIFEINKKRVD